MAKKKRMTTGHTVLELNKQRREIIRLKRRLRDVEADNRSMKARLNDYAHIEQAARFWGPSKTESNHVE